MMNVLLHSWRRALLESAGTARVAGTATAATAALCGQIEDGDPVSPINAISHIVWGDEAFQQRSVSLKYTMTGLLLNDSALVTWAALYQLFFGAAKRRGNIGAALGGGLVMALVAYLVDYHVVPERLKPGFEKHLMPRSLLLIYLVMALCFGLTGLRRQR